MKRCMIIAGSPDFMKSEPLPGDFVIACDRGYEHARAAGIKVDLIVGDMDSCQLEPDSEIPIIRLPREKDETDTVFAMNYAQTRGFTDFLILGALGGRLDHTLANLQATASLSEKGCNCRILDEKTTILMVSNGRIMVPFQPSYSLSVFSFTDNCSGVTVNGVKYSLQDATLNSRFPLGISNEWDGEEAVIGIEEGTLMIVLSRIERE